MPRIELERIAQTNTTTYPDEHAAMVADRWVRRLVPAIGLEDFGVSHVVLKPGAGSSHRHWHEDEDEFVVILSGEAVLVEDAGRTPMRAGDMAAFPKGEPDGHHLLNEGGEDCVFIAFGRPPTGDCHYSDIDMVFSRGAYLRRDRSAY